MAEIKLKLKIKWLFYFILCMVSIGPLGCSFISWDLGQMNPGNWRDNIRLAYLFAGAICGYAFYFAGYKHELKCIQKGW